MRRFLLALYPRPWRQRYGAEIAELLRQEPLSLRLVVDLVRGALDARVHPELAGPILAAAGGGTVQVPSRGPRIGFFVLTVVLLLFIIFGGLYAYRSETPALPQVPLTQVISEINAGQVRSIVLADHIATVTLDDGSKQTAALGGQPGDDLITQAVIERSRTNPAAPVQLRSESGGSGSNPLAPILPPLSGLFLTLLPVALLALLVLLLARRLARGPGVAQRASRYEWLARIADLRDRGVLTEEEFQREKARLLE